MINLIGLVKWLAFVVAALAGITGILVGGDQVGENSRDLGDLGAAIEAFPYWTLSAICFAFSLAMAFGEFFVSHSGPASEQGE